MSIGRITTMMTSQTVLGDIEQAYGAMTTSEQQLSSGKRINQPSDDPYGTSLVMSLQSQLSMIGQYNTNVNDGTAWTQASDAAMSNISNIVQRVQELTIEAANGTANQGDMQDTAQEVNQLIDQVKQEADTQYNGQYLFAGTGSAAPYQAGSNDAYGGNDGSVARLIGPGTQLQINANLASVLGSGQTDASGKPVGLLATLRDVAGNMTSGNSSGLQSTDIKALQDSVNALTQLQATNGAVTDRLQLASSQLQSLQVSDTQQLSTVQDADMAQVEINFSNQQAAYEAALRAGANIVQSSLMDFLSTS